MNNLLPLIALRWADSQEDGFMLQASRQLQDSYRQGLGSAAAGIDLRAYAVTRLPATSAAVLAVCDELRRHAPEFAPQRLLDLGAGPGTASWVAASLWPELEKITLLDHHPAFLALARRFLTEAFPPALRQADVVQGDMSATPLPGADLTILSYALAEVQTSQAATIARRAWETCAGVLLIIEPGTPRGFERILAARRELVAAEANILAPCPHTAACPLVQPDWCRFSVRLARSRRHKQAKGARLGYEDEPFSYVIASKKAFRGTARRIVKPPRRSKGEISLSLCGKSGFVSLQVSRRDNVLYKAAKKADWGDEWPVMPEKET